MPIVAVMSRPQQIILNLRTNAQLLRCNWEGETLGTLRSSNSNWVKGMPTPKVVNDPGVKIEIFIWQSRGHHMQTFSPETQASRIMSASLSILDNSSPTQNVFILSSSRQCESKLKTSLLKRLAESSMERRKKWWHRV